MAALQLHEDKNTGRLILQPALTARLGNLIFGLIWLVGVGIFLLPMFESKRIDWLMLIAFLVFAFVPVSASILNAIFATTVTIDRHARTLSSARLLLFLPIAKTTLAFNHLAKIEVQYVSGSSAVNAWLVNVVSRDNRRIRVNWNGAADEMKNLAQKISEWTGAPVVQAEYVLPTVLQDVLEQVVPTMREQAEQSQPAMPPLPEAYAPSSGESVLPQEVSAPAPVADKDMPAKSVWDLPIAALEQCVTNDSMDAEARYALARRYHSRGDLDRAIELYRQAARIDPVNPNTQNDLGVALQARGKRIEAEAAYRRAAALAPFSSTAHLNLALLLRSLNRATEASQEFFLARQNARGVEERNAAEQASSGAKMEPRLSKT